MAKRHRDLLARLEPVGLNRYRITEADVQTVEKYLNIIQKDLKGESTWQDIVQYTGPYGTSILIHEIVEIRALKARGVDPLRQKTQVLRKLLADHVEAHVIAVYEEHIYLQEIINRLFGQKFEVATLIKANTNDERDLELFLESDIGIYLLEEERVEAAQQAIAMLKGEKTI
ncbi:MAG: hypothetical protein BroJett011_07750 [Chloroflexota bacterium]|nr:MAG: hypothetical protein BroJett011_07750 [Chloroflexota bacterium]